MVSPLLERWRLAWRRRVVLPARRLLAPEAELTVDGRPFRVDLRDRVIGRLIFESGDYAPHVKEMLRLSARPGTVCLDIGANIGLYTVALAERVGTGGQVLAFEPEAHNYRLLEHNLRLNRLTNVTPFRSAVGARRGSVCLRNSTENFGDHRVCASGQSTGEQVAMTSIDDVLADLPARPVSVAKIDVQGFELEVLRGMRRTLERNPDMVIVLEVFPAGLQDAGASAAELMRELRAAGFGGYEFSDWRVQPLGEPETYDWLRAGKDVDCVVSADTERVDQVMAAYLQRVLGITTGPSRSFFEASL